MRLPEVDPRDGVAGNRRHAPGRGAAGHRRLAWPGPPGMGRVDSVGIVDHFGGGGGLRSAGTVVAYDEAARLVERILCVAQHMALRRVVGLTQISRYQLILMLIWTVLGTGVLTMPGTITRFTLHDAWLASGFLMLGGGLSAAVAWLHVRLFPRLTFTRALREVFGPWLGTIAGIWYAVWLLISIATIGREFSAFVTTTTLPDTPEYLVGALAFACVAYLVYLGLEVVARVTEFILPLAGFVLPLLFLLALRWFEWDPFQPVLSDGLLPVWRAGIVPAFAYGLEFVLALQWVPALKNPRTLPLDILLAAAISSVLLLLLVVVSVGVIGAPLAYLNFPVLEVVRAIHMGKFVERLDTWYGMGVVSTLVLKLATFHLALSQTLSDLCRTQDLRWTVLPIALASWVGSYFFFRNVAELTTFILHTVPVYFLCTAILLPLMTSAAWMLRRMWTSSGR